MTSSNISVSDLATPYNVANFFTFMLVSIDSEILREAKYYIKFMPKLRKTIIAKYSDCVHVALLEYRSGRDECSLSVVRDEYTILSGSFERDEVSITAFPYSSDAVYRLLVMLAKVVLATPLILDKALEKIESNPELASLYGLV